VDDDRREPRVPDGGVLDAEEESTTLGDRLILEIR